ncbi:uncharacterized protein V6R79_015425 [Siganus canaliculatus]
MIELLFICGEYDSIYWCLIRQHSVLEKLKTGKGENQFTKSTKDCQFVPAVLWTSSRGLSLANIYIQSALQSPSREKLLEAAEQVAQEVHTAAGNFEVVGTILAFVCGLSSEQVKRQTAEGREGEEVAHMIKELRRVLQDGGSVLVWNQSFGASCPRR